MANYPLSDAFCAIDKEDYDQMFSLVRQSMAEYYANTPFTREVIVGMIDYDLKLIIEKVKYKASEDIVAKLDQIKKDVEEDKKELKKKFVY